VHMVLQPRRSTSTILSCFSVKTSTNFISIACILLLFLFVMVHVSVFNVRLVQNVPYKSLFCIAFWFCVLYYSFYNLIEFRLFSVFW
jgi:hypothetical protein